jgi:hypothetical protein
LSERITAFHHGWWIMAAITLAGLIPTFLYIRRQKQQTR